MATPQEQVLLPIRGSCKCSFNTPSTLHTNRSSYWMNSKMFSNIGQATSNTEHFKDSVRPLISALNFLRFPAAIFWIVSLVVFLSFQCHIHSGFSHVCVKVGEYQPPLANCDSTTTVGSPSWIIGVCAPRNHVFPHVVNSRIAHSVSEGGYFGRHNDVNSIVVFSGGRPATTGAHCDYVVNST